MNSPTYNHLKNELNDQGIDVQQVESRLADLKIETPSWGFSGGGTRFKVFTDSNDATNVQQRIDDAAYVHRLTGTAPSIALHIPWDLTEDWRALSQYAVSKGISIGAINPNLFQDEDYKLGSLCHPNSSVRAKAIAHCLDCCRIMRETGSDLLSLWLADGTNYAGQDSIRDRRHRLKSSLETIFSALPDSSRLLLEYKFYEPAFFHTDVADWGTSFALCQALGDNAQVLVDMGHHAPGTNIAYIVAQLLDEDCLGGFHFNDSNYGDDDLIIGSSDPWRLFIVFHEILSAPSPSRPIAYMLDQSHNIEPKTEAMIMSILNCQTAYAKALIVDQTALKNAQACGDVLAAHRVLQKAFETDVRPLTAHVRSTLGASPDPLADHQRLWPNHVKSRRGF